MGRIPLWIKIVWTAFLAVWIPFYWKHYGPQNFLWFCDLANVLLAAALWAESPLLLSSQAVSVLVVQLLWVVDVGGRLLTGKHWIGGTAYMFQSDIKLIMRLLSLFHVAVPILIVWALARIGYDRRGLRLQCVVAWVILPVCFLGWGPEKNINWVYGLFDKPQSTIPSWAFFGLMMAGYPLVLYLPSHLLLRSLPWFRRPPAAANK